MKWFRLYHDLIDDPKVQRLPGDTFKFWINCLCLASRSEERGTIALDMSGIAFALRVDDDTAKAHVAALITAGLLEPNGAGLAVHNWGGRQYRSDDVNARSTAHRKAKKATGSEGATLHATPDATLPATVKPSARDRGDTESDTEAEERESAGAAAPPAPANPPDSGMNDERPKRATPIPADWAVTEPLRQYAREKGLPDCEIDHEVEAFVVHYRGNGERRADWAAVFREWVLREVKWRQDGRRRPGSNGKGAIVQPIARDANYVAGAERYHGLRVDTVDD